MTSVSTDSSVLAVCVVHEVIPNLGDDPDTTAIDKRPATGRLRVDALGLDGDLQVDRRHHGGVDKAVYAYADSDAAWWAHELGRDVPYGFFGENLRTEGIDVTNAVIGERWQVGDGEAPVLLEVTMPRIPCMTFQRRMGEDRWVKRFAEHGAPGAYLRVLRDGDIGAGDRVQVVQRPEHGVSVADSFLPTDGAAMRRLLDAADAGQLVVADALRQHAVRAAARS